MKFLGLYWSSRYKIVKIVGLLVELNVFGVVVEPALSEKLSWMEQKKIVYQGLIVDQTLGVVWWRHC